MAVSDYSFSINGWGFGPEADQVSDSATFAYTYGLAWGVTEVAGLKDRPSVRSADTPRPYAHGTFAGADRYDGRTITVTLQLLTAWDKTPAQFADYVRALELATQVTDVAQTCLFKMPGWGHTGSLDSDIIRVKGRVRRCAIGMQVNTYGIQAPVAVLDIYCNDPYIYSQIDDVADFTTPSSNVGRTYNMNFPVDYGGSSRLTLANLSNYGSAPALLTVDFYGPCTNPFLNNLDSDSTFQLNTTIATNDFVRCNFSDQTVLFDGVTNQRNRVAAGSSFWTIAPTSTLSDSFVSQGDTVSFGYASGSAPAHAVVTYASTWL